MFLLIFQVLERIKDPLQTMISRDRFETAYAVLTNFLIIVQRAPLIFSQVGVWIILVLSSSICQLISSEFVALWISLSIVGQTPVPDCTPHATSLLASHGKLRLQAGSHSQCAQADQGPFGSHNAKVPHVTMMQNHTVISPSQSQCHDEQCHHPDCIRSNLTDSIDKSLKLPSHCRFIAAFIAARMSLPI